MKKARAIAKASKIPSRALTLEETKELLGDRELLETDEPLER